MNDFNLVFSTYDSLFLVEKIGDAEYSVALQINGENKKKKDSLIGFVINNTLCNRSPSFSKSIIVSDFAGMYYCCIFGCFIDSFFPKESREMYLIVTNENKKIPNVQKIADYFAYLQDVLRKRAIGESKSMLKNRERYIDIEELESLALSDNTIDDYDLGEDILSLTEKRPLNIMLNGHLNSFVLLKIQSNEHYLNMVDFGIPCLSLLSFAKYVSSGDSKSLFAKLARSPVLTHIIYNILCSQPLVIISKNAKQYYPFAIKLVSYVPCFNESQLSLTETSVHDLRYKIAVGNSIDNEIEYQCSMIDIDNKMFHGLLCKRDSFLWKHTVLDQGQSGSSFIASTYYWIKNIADTMFNSYMDYIETCTEKSKRSFSMFMNERGLRLDDYYMFANWMSFINLEYSKEFMNTNPHPVGTLYF